MLFRNSIFILGATISITNPAYSETQEHAEHAHRSASSAMLTAPGNDAFGAIQEVVSKLMSDPKTDWKRVNLEALRQHLVDMANTTLYVEVMNQKPTKNGITFTVKPTVPSAAASLDRTMSAHSEVLRKEIGWEFRAKKLNSGWRVDVTSSKPDEVVKIQGLGYIGMMALGNHHQPHHWQMATGGNPHAH